MGGNAGINAIGQQIAGEFQVAPVHIALPRKGHGSRFEVSSFAQADADFRGAELFDIRLAAIQVGLNDDAHRAVAGVQRVYQVERAICVVARLHIDADEAGEFGGASHELSYIGQALLPGKIEAELSEFERNAALDTVAMDGVEGPQVDVAGFGGFFQGGHAFAEVVEGHGDALGVEFAGDRQGLIERFASHEPGSEPLREGGGFHPAA